ncbi:MAG: T9SS type A sorting domain-containing protein [Ignavibacteria bacterium]|nr:T9SS type A sorting domain-containing protein [Ignavibacteria bacterium]
MKNLLQRLALLIALVMLSSLSYSQKGWWKFDNPADLTAAVPGFGNALELTGTQTAIAGPTVNNGAVTVPKGSYYKMTHGIAPNGGGAKVNQFTLMFDFKIAATAWHNFFQTDSTAAGSDGDLFINTSNFIGTWALGYASTPIVNETWYRLVVSCDNTHSFKTYLGGQLLKDGAVSGMDMIDGRYSLRPFLLLFADDDGDDGDIDIAEAAIWDYALTSDEVLALGGIGGALPVELSSFNAVQLKGSVVLNWETATEKNNSGFAVERKSENQNWQQVGFVSGYGTSTEKHNYTYTDQTVASGKYSYRLKQMDHNGTFEYSQVVEVLLTPSEFKMYNNYPNPFNPSTIIAYELPADAFVTLRVYNTTGEQVAELVNEFQITGKYNKSFNTSSLNSSLPSGIYFAELRANEKVQRIKMMLLK